MNIKELKTITLTQEEFEKLERVVEARDDGAAQYICGYLLGKAQTQFMLSQGTNPERDL